MGIFCTHRPECVLPTWGCLSKPLLAALLLPPPLGTKINGFHPQGAGKDAGNGTNSNRSISDIHKNHAYEPTALCCLGIKQSKMECLCAKKKGRCAFRRKRLCLIPIRLGASYQSKLFLEISHYFNYQVFD